jgi:hypothetical protein
LKSKTLWQRQSDRWDEHYLHKRRASVAEQFRELELEFVGADSDRREEILKDLDAELLSETAITPEQATLPSQPAPRPITRRDLEAAAEGLKAKRIHVA